MKNDRKAKNTNKAHNKREKYFPLIASIHIELGNNLLSEESNRLKTLFDRFDVDKTGVINAKEMKVILQLAQLDKLAETICDDITRLNFSEFMNKFKTMPISEEQLELLKKIPVDAANRIGIELRENPNSFQITADEKFNISTQRVLRCKQAFDILDIDLSGRITQEALTSQLQKIGIKFDAAKLNNIFKHADNDDAKEFLLGDFVLASCSKRSSTSVRNLRLIAKELAKIIYCSNGESPQGKSLETAEQLFVDSATYQKMPGYKPDKFYFIFNAFDDLDYNLDGVLSKNNLKLQNHEEFNPNEKQMYEILCLAWEDHNLYFDDFYKYMVLAPIDVRVLATTARKIGRESSLG